MSIQLLLWGQYLTCHCLSAQVGYSTESFCQHLQGLFLPSDRPRASSSAAVHVTAWFRSVYSSALCRIWKSVVTGNLSSFRSEPKRLSCVVGNPNMHWALSLLQTFLYPAVHVKSPQISARGEASRQSSRWPVLRSWSEVLPHIFSPLCETAKGSMDTLLPTACQK